MACNRDIFTYFTRRLYWTDYAAGVRETKEACRILAKTLKSPFGRSRRRREYNIKLEFREMGSEEVGETGLQL
jgi:hypothetical protein